MKRYGNVKGRIYREVQTDGEGKRKATKTKVCTSCGEVKTLDEFYRRRRLKDGFDNVCKACYRKRSEKMVGDENK